MHEDHSRSTTGHEPRAAGDDNFNTTRTDPKFARESNTMRRMLPWQIIALAVAALAVVGLVVFYV